MFQIHKNQKQEKDVLVAPSSSYSLFQIQNILFFTFENIEN